MQLLITLLTSIMLVACGQSSAPNSVAANAPAEAVASRMAAPAQMLVPAKMAADSIMGGAEQSMTEISEPQNLAQTAELKKYIALSHQLNVEVSAETMQENFDAAMQHCEALHCQILSANFVKQTAYSPPSASLRSRVPPRNVAIFLSGLAKNGEIMQHMRKAEDKTNQVIDADARIKNLTELRDRLRSMLVDKSAKFKDIIDVERELANTQSQLDSMLSMRKILRLETDFVAVNIDFSAKQGMTEQGFFAPVARAMKEAGHVMMESFAAVITFLMTAIPWLLIGIPLLLLIRKCWLKLKSKFFPT